MSVVLISLPYRRSITALLMIILFSPGVAQDSEKIKTESEPVYIDVVVKDAEGMRVADLKKEDFEIYEDGVLQEITHFRPMNQPMRLVLLFDVSTSMEAMIPAIKNGAAKLVESLTQLDEVIIASFSIDLELPTRWSGRAVATSEILELKSTAVPRNRPTQPMPEIPRGRRMGGPDVNTDLYGALHTIFEKFGGRGGNEVILLISDGTDSVDGNRAKERPVNDSKQIIREAQESWVQVYAACYKTEGRKTLSPFDIIRRGKDGQGANCKFLSEVAGATGGRVFEFELQGESDLVLKKTLDELRSQYSLAYFPTAKGNRVGLHKIRAVVKRPGVVVRAREGYLISK
jgi:Ca-activated chloride channel homolog